MSALDRFVQPADGVVFGVSRRQRRRLRVASRREGPLHTVADVHAKRIDVAVRYAFALARRALPRTATTLVDAEPAVAVLRAALLDVLPATLEQALVAGGQVGVEQFNTGVKSLRVINRDGTPAVHAAELFTLGDEDAPIDGELRTAKRSLGFTFNVSNPRVSAWALQHAAELVTDVTNTTRDWIREAVAASADGQLTDRGLHDAIALAIGDDVRADTIARTESMRAVHQGQRESWDQAVDAGLLTGAEKRVWIVTQDDALCPLCAPLEAKKATLDGVYPGGVDGPPLHPRCRCTEGLA